MSDGCEALRLHKGKCLQQVHSTTIVRNRLHGTAQVAQLIQIRLILGEQWVSWGKGDPPTFSEFMRILSSGAASQTEYHSMADAIVGGMQAKGCR